MLKNTADISRYCFLSWDNELKNIPDKTLCNLLYGYETCKKDLNRFLNKAPKSLKDPIHQRCQELADALELPIYELNRKIREKEIIIKTNKI